MLFRSGSASGGSAPGSGGAPVNQDGAAPSPDAGSDAPAPSDVPLVPAPGEYGSAPVMLMPDAEMAVATVGERVYVLGGAVAGGVLRSLMIFDTVKGEWSMGAPLPTPVHHPVAIGVGGKLYSLGGQKDMSASPDRRGRGRRRDRKSVV